MTWIPSLVISSLISVTMRVVFSSSRAASICTVNFLQCSCLVEDVQAERIVAHLSEDQRDGEERLLAARQFHQSYFSFRPRKWTRFPRVVRVVPDLNDNTALDVVRIVLLVMAVCKEHGNHADLLLGYLRITLRLGSRRVVCSRS